MRLGNVPRAGRAKKLAWALSLLAVLSVPVAWYSWSTARQQASDLASAAVRQAAVQPVLREAQARLGAWASLMAEVAPTRELLKGLGEVPGQWQSQTVALENQPMSRREAERYLLDLQSNEQRVLAATAIHLRPAQAGESLFAEHQGQDARGALLVTVKAELFTRKLP